MNVATINPATATVKLVLNDARAIAAASLFTADKYDLRDFLQCVHIRNLRPASVRTYDGVVRIEATNGHQLIQIDDIGQIEGADALMVRPAAGCGAGAWKDIRAKRAGSMACVIEGNDIYVGGVRVALEDRSDVGHYPKCDRVVPEPVASGGVMPAYNPAYLAVWDKALAALGIAGGRAVRITAADATSAGLVEVFGEGLGDFAQVRGAIMPVRV